MGIRGVDALGAEACNCEPPKSFGNSGDKFICGKCRRVWMYAFERWNIRYDLQEERVPSE